MSTVKATNFQHPSSAAANITLGSDGSVVLPAGFSGGLGTNLVQAFKTDKFTTTSTSYVSVTGLSITITPTSATSKVLLVASMAVGASGAFALQVSFARGGSLLAQSTGNTTEGTYSSNIKEMVSGTSSGVPLTMVFLDSPASASAQTYTVDVKTNGTSVTVGGAVSSYGAVSTLTAIEVAA